MQQAKFIDIDSDCFYLEFYPDVIEKCSNYKRRIWGAFKHYFTGLYMWKEKENLYKICINPFPLGLGTKIVSFISDCHSFIKEDEIKAMIGLSKHAEHVIRSTNKYRSENVKRSQQLQYHSNFKEEWMEPLKDYQKHAVDFLLKEDGNMILADPMGLGKTIEAIFFMIGKRKEMWDYFPTLVTCPSSLKFNWKYELKKWGIFKEEEIDIVQGTTHDIPDGKKCVICNYEVVHKEHIFKQLKKCKFKIFIADECHKLKNHKAKCSKACIKLSKSIPSVIPMTGTLFPNGMPEEALNAIIMTKNIHAFGGRTEYLKKYCGYKVTPAKLEGDKLAPPVYERHPKWKPSPKIMEKLNKDLRKICLIRRDKKEALKQLPPKTIEPLIVEIEKTSEYMQIVEDFESYIKDKYTDNYIEEGLDYDKARSRAIAKFVAVSSQEDTVDRVKVMNLRKIIAKLKLKKVKEVIDDKIEQGIKICVFAHHKEVQDELIKLYPDACKIVSSMPSEERDKNVREFQGNEDKRLFIGSIKACSTGITLTAANEMIIVELVWNPDDIMQLEDRIHRIGQEKKSYIYYPIAYDTIEESIWEYVWNKRSLINIATKNIE